MCKITFCTPCAKQVMLVKKHFFNFSGVIWNPLCEIFNLGYLPTFSEVCKCVKNAFKSAATTTAARFLKTISPGEGPQDLLYA